MFERHHLDGSYGTFVTFVSVFSATTVEGLLEVFGGDESVDHGLGLFGVQTSESVGGALTDIVEVGRIATNDASDGYDGIDLLLRQLGGAIDEFETAGHVHHGDVFRCYVVLHQGVEGATKERFGHAFVPFADHDAKAHSFAAWHFRGVVFGEVVFFGSNFLLLFLFIFILSKNTKDSLGLLGLPCLLVLC